MKHITIALDGPAGSGKSTIAGIVAEKLGLIHLDTGAMYRAAGLYALEHGVLPMDRESVKKMLDKFVLEVTFDDDKKQHVTVNGCDVTDKIRTQEVSKAASDIATIPEVRLYLVKLQRQISQSVSIILDGRDIGSYVLPDATAKIYLTATPQERARRRLKEMQEKGLCMDKTLDEMTREITDRDYTDMHREFAPLTVADGASVVDTTDMTIDEVVNKIIEIAGV